MFIRLKITQEEARLMERAKELGFTSPTWKAGDYLEGTFDESCFDIAKLMWADRLPHETPQPPPLKNIFYRAPERPVRSRPYSCSGGNLFV